MSERSERVMREFGSPGLDPFETIPITEENRVDHVSYTGKYAVICGVSDVPFMGEATIDYEPGESLLELESFDAWVISQARESFTVESWTRFLFDVLYGVLDARSLTVYVRAQTPVHGDIYCEIKGGLDEFEINTNG